jgi:hypothetical protein
MSETPECSPHRIRGFHLPRKLPARVPFRHEWNELGGPVVIDRHDERILLLLGLLTTQSQHGYQINEFIEHNLGRV